jgi:sulfate adenylyltransferase subunit 1
MGIAKLVVAVNKMDHDTVEWSDTVYSSVKSRLGKLLEPLKFIQIQYVPISALEGINIVDKENAVTVGTEKSNLMDTIINTKLNFNRVITVYEAQTRIKVKIQFRNIESVVTIGYTCNLHSAHSVVGCTLSKLYHTRPFVLAIDKDVMEVDLLLDEPTDIKTFVILRDGDKTVGIGKMVGNW